MMARLTVFLTVVVMGIIGAGAVFGLAEVIHHSGLNPFASPASVEASSPALTTDRAGMGLSE